MNTILSVISKMTVQRDGENYNYFNDMVRPVGQVDAAEGFFATAEPMENTLRESDPQFHPIIENQSFDVKGADENIKFKVITSGIEKRTGFCWSISHQRQIVSSEDPARNHTMGVNASTYPGGSALFNLSSSDSSIAAVYSTTLLLPGSWVRN